jgi:hypothetical protein
VQHGWSYAMRARRASNSGARSDQGNMRAREYRPAPLKPFSRPIELAPTAPCAPASAPPFRSRSPRARWRCSTGREFEWLPQSRKPRAARHLFHRLHIARLASAIPQQAGGAVRRHPFGPTRCETKLEILRSLWTSAAHQSTTKSA